MRLYVYPHSPISRKVLLAMYEKGLTIESEIVPPTDEAHKERIREQVYPLATIPMLVLDDGSPMPESSIIVEYLDLTFEEAPQLIPRDPRVALAARAFDRLGDVLLDGTAYLAWALRKPQAQQHPGKIASSFKSVKAALGSLDSTLATKSFLVGDDLTVADLGCVCAVASLLADRSLPDLVPWPHVARWHSAITSRPSWRRMVEEASTVPLPAGFDH